MTAIGAGIWAARSSVTESGGQALSVSAGLGPRSSRRDPTRLTFERR